MNLKISLGAAIAFMAIVAAAAVSITAMVTLRSFNRRVSDLQQREERYGQIAQLDELVRENYIGEVGQESLMRAIAEGFLAGVGDPDAQYLDAAQYARELRESGGKVVQVGLVTSMDDSGYMRVDQVYPDSPALAAEIAPEDLITKVGDLDVTKENYQQAVGSLLGEAGTKVTLVVRNQTKERELELTRRFVESPSVTSELLENNVGRITFTEFNTGTPEQFIRQVDNLIGNGAVALVLDIRGVDNASVDPVCEVLDKMVSDGVLVYMLEKNGLRTELKIADGRSVDLPIAVLQNDKTAGEAELISAVLRDVGKARLIGMTTKGKSTVQSLLPLKDGSGAIRLTTAMYLPPSGESFNGVGVKPDFDITMTEEQNALAKADIQYDLQMTKALEVVLTGVKTPGGVTEQIASESVSEQSTPSEMELPVSVTEIETEAASSSETTSGAESSSSSEG